MNKVYDLVGGLTICLGVSLLVSSLITLAIWPLMGGWSWWIFGAIALVVFAAINFIDAAFFVPMERESVRD